MVIMVNTIEHCANVVRVFDNVYKSLKLGSVFIMGEEIGQKRMLKGTSLCHPIQLTKDFYHFYMSKFFELLMPARTGNEVGGAFDVPGAKNSIYAIGRKPLSTERPFKQQ